MHFVLYVATTADGIGVQDACAVSVCDAVSHVNKLATNLPVLATPSIIAVQMRAKSEGRSGVVSPVLMTMVPLFASSQQAQLPFLQQ